MGRVTITSDNLADAIERELTVYHEEVNEKLREVTRKSMTDLVRKTRATAPEGKRGLFRKAIAGDFRGLKRGNRKVSATWYVRKPHHRLTHLLVKSHPTPNGGSTKANPFLQNALDEVLPNYENEIKEALKNGK
jgi:hypothetical protein